MATLADLLSVPTEIEFEYEGQVKKYPIGKPGQLVQGKYQRWLEQNAREGVDRATYLSDEGKERAERVVSRDIAAKVYCWGGEVCVLALQTPEGIQKYLELLLNIPPAEAAALVEFRLKVIAEIVRAMQAKDPKALGAALATLGLPADFLRPRKNSSSASGTRRSGSQKRKSKR